MIRRLSLAAVLALTATGALAEDLRICVEGAYPPFSEVNAQGEVVGFDIDIANALCAEMGKSCEMVQTDWDGIIPSLLERKCDAIIAQMSITEDRKKVIDFSKKYSNSPNMFAARAGFYKVADIKDAVVGVQRGTIHQDFMETEMPDVELRLYGTQDEVYLDMQAGRIDATVGDAIQIEEGFVKTENGKGFHMIREDVTVPAIHGEGAGIAVRQNEAELRDAFTAAIQAIRDNGTYKEINDKYFPVDVYGS